MKVREIKWPGMARRKTEAAPGQRPQNKNKRGDESKCQCRSMEFGQSGKRNIHIAGQFFMVAQAAQSAFQMQRRAVLMFMAMRGVIEIVQVNAHPLRQKQHGQQ